MNKRYFVLACLFVNQVFILSVLNYIATLLFGVVTIPSLLTNDLARKTFTMYLHVYRTCLYGLVACL